ncbi:unnamed protein product [Orchesella dallaii]|uniref:Uncharacterized protein n=1 Tax=Orchesella dallaii TaxID=48710 RepID=A0ABP1PXX6_9HEXA
MVEIDITTFSIHLRMATCLSPQFLRGFNKSFSFDLGKAGIRGNKEHLSVYKSLRFHGGLGMLSMAY